VIRLGETSPAACAPKLASAGSAKAGKAAGDFFNGTIKTQQALPKS